MSTPLGLDGKIYRLTTGTRATWGAADSNGFHAGAAPTNLDVIDAVKDLNFKITKGKADMSKRGGLGWAQKRGTLKEATLELKCLWDNTDTDLAALLKAFIGNTSIALAVLDGDKATSGTQGLWADFEVFDLNKDEPLVEGQMMSFELEPADTAVTAEWVKVS